MCSWKAIDLGDLGLHEALVGGLVAGALAARRADLGVCGNEPIVVVGSSGSGTARPARGGARGTARRGRSPRAQRARPRAHRRVVRVRGRPARARHGPRRREQRVAVAAVRRLAEHAQLRELLGAERQPRADLGVDRRLARGLVGHVQQRARRRDRDPLGPQRGHRDVDAVEREVEVGRPHVAAVDHAERQPPGTVAQRVPELGGRAHEIEVQLGRAELEHARLGGREVGREADLDRRGGEGGEGLGVRVQLGGRAVEREARLVELDLGGARSRQLGEELRVHRHERLQRRGVRPSRAART